VRLHFQETPWDLYLVLAYMTSAVAILLALGVGNPISILLVLFVPGYVIVAALFPKSSEIGWVERIVLSFGVSIGVLPLLGLALNFTPWGIRFASIVAAIGLFTIGVGATAYWRRMRLPANLRLTATVDLAIGNWREYSIADKGLTVALAASVVAAAGTLAYTILTQRSGPTFTEFYLLGPEGSAAGYPTRLNVSQPGTVVVGIANHEAAATNYTARIDQVGVEVAYNLTAGVNETVEVNRTTWSWFNVTLADGQNWTHPYTFHFNAAGLWKVQFFLFKDGDLATRYRELHFYVRTS